MDSEPTPRPWTKEQETATRSKDWLIVHGEEVIANVYKEADADLIDRAVGEHHRLKVLERESGKALEAAQARADALAEALRLALEKANLFPNAEWRKKAEAALKAVSQ